QLAGFVLEIRHSHVRQPLQPRAEAALRTPRPLGYAPQLPLVPGEKADDEVRFFHRVGTQDESFTDTRRHTLRNFRVSQMKRSLAARTVIRCAWTSRRRFSSSWSRTPRTPFRSII